MKNAGEQRSVATDGSVVVSVMSCEQGQYLDLMDETVSDIQNDGKMAVFVGTAGIVPNSFPQRKTLSLGSIEQAEGIAIGTAGTDTAIESTDIALLSDDLTKLS